MTVEEAEKNSARPATPTVKAAWSVVKTAMRRRVPAAGAFISAAEALSEEIRRRHWRRSRTAKVSAWLAQSPRYLVLGAGTAVLPGWLNADLNPRVGGGLIFIDVTEPLPLPDECADIILSEHMIEHIDFRQGHAMLRECFRALKPGGVLRVATPDLAVLLALYTHSLNAEQSWYVQYVADHMIEDCPRPDPVFVINNEFRAYGHQFLYDEATLRWSLERAGFHEVRRYPMGESPNPVLAGIEGRTKRKIPGRYEMRSFETMAFEARRPI